ncbi:peptidase [Shewanella sp. OPT22]|nr:peptidase [Shewanella sp. OPT22]
MTRIHHKKGVIVKKSLIILSLITCSFTTQANNLIKNDLVHEQKNCFQGPFENYDSWINFFKKLKQRKIKEPTLLAKTIESFDKRFGEIKFNEYKTSLSCRNFKYTVDGNIVKGFIIKPKQTEESLPVLVYNRGGNGNYGSMVFGNLFNSLFPIANRGFIIIGSQYRGSLTSSDTLDEFGGKDVHDVIELFKFIPDIVGADPTRIGMFGGSRGGMQTFLTLKEIDSVKAVVTSSGIYDLPLTLKTQPKFSQMFKHRIPNFDSNKAVELEKRSVTKWVDKIPKKVPILIIHGEKDQRVSVENAKNLVTEFSKNKIPHKLIVYSNDDHYLSKNSANAIEATVDWFRKHL